VATRLGGDAPAHRGNPNKRTASHHTARTASAKFSSATYDQDISALLERFIIPRLVTSDTAALAAHPSNIFPGSQETGDAIPILAPAGIKDSAIAEFANLSVTSDTEALMECIHSHLADGHSVEGLFLNLLAPAARALGKYWENDSLDFVAVTMGLWRIQEVLREISMRIPPAIQPARGRRRALFAPIPGEQHSFGIIMLGEYFERAGWDADVLMEPSYGDLNHQLAGHHYDLVAISISCDGYTDALHGLIASMKSISKNSKIRVLIGGHAVNANPELVGTCGADGTGIDASQTIALANKLIPHNIDMFGTLVTG
jgi:MerR family transcriptional regulator, light-induced transcriptional regulator